MQSWSDLGNGVAALVASAVVIVVLFIIGREFICWYFKVNETSRKMDQVILLL